MKNLNVFLIKHLTWIYFGLLWVVIDNFGCGWVAVDGDGYVLTFGWWW